MSGDRPHGRSAVLDLADLDGLGEPMSDAEALRVNRKLTRSLARQRLAALKQRLSRAMAVRFTPPKLAP